LPGAAAAQGQERMLTLTLLPLMISGVVQFPEVENPMLFIVFHCKQAGRQAYIHALQDMVLLPQHVPHSLISSPHFHQNAVLR
jgi:hypothetical protein